MKPILSQSQALLASIIIGVFVVLLGFDGVFTPLFVVAAIASVMLLVLRIAGVVGP